MNTILPFFAVQLNENETPGAKLAKNIKEENSVREIKRWLSCRKQSTTGKKAQEIPKFYSYCHIYQHLIETCVLEGHTNFREAAISADKLNVENSYCSTAKPLRRGRMYFDSGHVTDMQDSKTVEGNQYCVRSLVLACYRKDQYNVFVMHINSFISFCTNSHAKKRCAVRLHFFINHP